MGDPGLKIWIKDIFIKILYCIKLNIRPSLKINRVLHVRLLPARAVEPAYKLVIDHSKDGDRQAQEGLRSKRRAVRGFGKELHFGQGRLKVETLLNLKLFERLKRAVYFGTWKTSYFTVCLQFTNEWLFLYYVFFCIWKMYFSWSLIYNQVRFFNHFGVTNKCKYKSTSYVWLFKYTIFLCLVTFTTVLLRYNPCFKYI